MCSVFDGIFILQHSYPGYSSPRRTAADIFKRHLWQTALMAYSLHYWCGWNNTLWKIFPPYPGLIAPCCISEVGTDYIFWEHWWHQVSTGCQANTLTGILLLLLTEATAAYAIPSYNAHTITRKHQSESKHQQEAQRKWLVDASSWPDSTLTWQQLSLMVLLHLVWDTVFKSETEPHAEIFRRALGIKETDSWTPRVWLPAMGVNGTCTLGYLSPLPFRQ